MPQQGTIQWIGLRAKKKGDVNSVTQVQISEKDGLENDHYSKEGGHRMVTLIQAEHIEAVASILGKNIEPESLRRNIVVTGINLTSLQDRQFRIGENVILEGTGPCVPCSRMEENLGPGGYNAMRGHGGITARVISGGLISLGDTVHLHLEA